MWLEVKIIIRPFDRDDITKKVQWINDPENNQYLHYDVPLTYEKTEKWYESHRDQENRYDATIEADGKPIGIVGLLDIDKKNSKAEYYITVGEKEYKGKGIATKATDLILEYAFRHINLNRVYLYVESQNTNAISLYERVGFIKEGELRDDILSHGILKNRIIYGLLRRDWELIREQNSYSELG